MLFPTMSTEAYTTHPWQANNDQSGQHIRPKSIGLLQRCVDWAAEVNNCSTAARSERCCEINTWSRSEWSRDSGTIRAALASFRAKVTFKLCVLMHLDHTGRSPSYLSDLVTLTSTIASRSPYRSGSSQRYEQPSTRLKLGEGSFAFAGPAAWNSLPTSLHAITNYNTFRRELKTTF